MSDTVFLKNNRDEVIEGDITFNGSVTIADGSVTVPPGGDVDANDVAVAGDLAVSGAATFNGAAIFNDEFAPETIGTSLPSLNASHSRLIAISDGAGGVLGYVKVFPPA